MCRRDDLSDCDSNSDASQNMEAGFTSQEEEEDFSRWVADKEDKE